jgi:hypothetical protein
MINHLVKKFRDGTLPAEIKLDENYRKVFEENIARELRKK